MGFISTVSSLNAQPYLEIFGVTTGEPVNDEDIETDDSIEASSLQAFLNNDVYNQCVASFTVTDGGSAEVNYDLDRDGLLDVGIYGVEALAIIDAEKDLNYDYNIFLVYEISGATGFTKKVQGMFLWKPL